MELVTNIFQEYRALMRSIWNCAFWQDADWDDRDSFEKVKALLFEALVERKLEARKRRFQVIPRADSGVPISIEQPRNNDNNHYWDHPIKSVKPSDVVLQFIDYFDWDALGFLDFQYLRVRILEFPSSPDLVGREALIDAQFADIGLAQNE